MIKRNTILNADVTRIMFTFFGNPSSCQITFWTFFCHININKLYLIAVIIYYIRRRVDTILILVRRNILYWCGVIFYIGVAIYFAIIELKTYIISSNIIAQVNSEYGIVLTMIKLMLSLSLRFWAEISAATCQKKVHKGGEYTYEETCTL